MQLRVPEENLRVPLAWFQDVWNRAEQLFRDDPTSRYLGGVCAACRWAAGHPQAVTPLHRRPTPATAELILSEDLLATMTYLGEPGGDPAVDRDRAAGVAMTLGWARGALREDPLVGG